MLGPVSATGRGAEMPIGDNQRFVPASGKDGISPYLNCRGLFVSTEAGPGLRAALYLPCVICQIWHLYPLSHRRPMPYVGRLARLPWDRRYFGPAIVEVGRRGCYPQRCGPQYRRKPRHASKGPSRRIFPTCGRSTELWTLPAHYMEGQPERPRAGRRAVYLNNRNESTRRQASRPAPITSTA